MGKRKRVGLPATRVSKRLRARNTAESTPDEPDGDRHDDAEQTADLPPGTAPKLAVSNSVPASRPTSRETDTGSACDGKQCAERARLEACNGGEAARWRLWGPYLSERQWGTVREDCSEDGNCWEHFSHEQATCRAYRWGEDGLLGICDNQAELCLALALWNGEDKILKERLFGLNGPQGNHGEDVKECYYYLDSTPTHSYMKALYKYPQAEFPYADLLEENQRRGLKDPEYELLDTGVFDDSRYWDVTAEYAKREPRDTIIVGLTLPQYTCYQLCGSGSYIFQVEAATPRGSKHPELLICDNDTNMERMADKVTQEHTGRRSSSPKDAFHQYIVGGNEELLGSEEGTKCAAHYQLTVAPGQHAVIRCRLLHQDLLPPKHKKLHSAKLLDDLVNQRQKEADDFYKTVIPAKLSQEEKSVSRQAYAGLCWTKQFFYYDVDKWLTDKKCINRDWKHMVNKHIISMPDKWEFPWYATWDLAFHVIPLADIDPEFAKSQLLLLLSDKYMHHTGQLPAYEFNFSDVNPPVHAWACLKVYRLSVAGGSKSDVTFLKKCFHRLSLNFNWWINKKSIDGRHLFSGGFLGLDNISCVNRSLPPEGTTIEQVDGTSWMAFFSLCMMEMALELAQHDDVYEDMALRFLEHFILIAEALNGHAGLYDEEDKFYYDRLRVDKDGRSHVLRVRSLVGLTPMFGTCVLEGRLLEGRSEFKVKLDTLVRDKPQFAAVATRLPTDLLGKTGYHGYLLSLVADQSRLAGLVSYMFDPEEFLSLYGVRALAKNQSFTLPPLNDETKEMSVTYCPGESDSDMFGGNSNWRGPVWLCMNALLVESLEKFGRHLGGSSSGYSGKSLSIARRLTQLFLPDNRGYRPCHGSREVYASDQYWNQLVLFYEYFHGDTGRGCGASHQTGWTALVACLLRELSEHSEISNAGVGCRFQ